MEYYKNLAIVESSNDPFAKNPKTSAKGRYQFVDKTGKQYGLDKYEFGTPEYEAAEQEAVEKFTRDNYNYLSKSLGREPTSPELYLAHQQGAKGATRLLKNPDKSALNLVGKKQVLNNGGSEDMTAADFANLWINKFNNIETETTTLPEQNQEYSSALQEGFIEVELPDGTIAEFPQNMSDDDIASVLQKEYPSDNSQEQGLLEKAEGFMRAKTQGDTFGFGDEIIAGLASVPSALITGNSVSDSYNQILDDERQRADSFRETNPALSIGGEIGGAIATGAGGAAKLGLGKLAQGSSKLGTLGRTTGLGGVSGGVYGYGTGSGGSGERLESGVRDAALGAVASPVGVAAAHMVGKVGRPLTNRVQRLFSSKQPTQLQNVNFNEIAEAKATPPQVSYDGGEQSAMQKIYKGLQKDYGDNADAVLQSWIQGDDALIDTYGAQSRNLAKGAAQYPSGQNQAERFFGERIAENPDKILTSIRSNITGDENYYATVDDILEVGRSKASGLYDKAYEGVIKDNSVIMLPEVQDALKKAYRNYPSKLKDAQPNSIQALDYAKRVLDDDIGKAMRSGETGYAKSRIEIKNTLLDAMDSASPEYKTARSVSGDYLGLTNAMEKGKAIFREDPELLSKSLKKMTDAEKTSFKSGVGKALRDEVEKKMDGGNVYNKIFGNETQRQRLQKILSPKEYKNFAEDLRATDRLFKMRNEILGGSPTMSKAQAAQEIAYMGADIADVASGGVTAVPRNAITAWAKKSFDGLNDDMANTISNILYETRPAEKLKLVAQIKKTKAIPSKQKKEVMRQLFAMEGALKQASDSRFIKSTASGSAAAQMTQGEN